MDHIEKIMHVKDRWIFALLMVIIVLASMLLGESAWTFSQPKGRLNCDSFGSYEQMETAYQDGDTYLDRDNDGKPCQDTHYAY